MLWFLTDVQNTRLTRRTSTDQSFSLSHEDNIDLITTSFGECNVYLIRSSFKLYMDLKENSFQIMHYFAKMWRCFGKHSSDGLIHFLKRFYQKLLSWKSSKYLHVWLHGSHLLQWNVVGCAYCRRMSMVTIVLMSLLWRHNGCDGVPNH